MTRTALLTLSVWLLSFGASEGRAQADSGRILPRARWPKNRAQIALPVPPQVLQADTGRSIVRGIVFGSARSQSRVFVAGIDAAHQPTGGAIPPDTDLATQLSIVDTKAQLRWVADYFGKRLPSAQRSQLAALYLEGLDSATAIDAIPATTASARDAKALRLSRMVARILLRERDLFALDTSAQRDRYGRVYSPPAVLDTTRMIQAIRAALFHDARGIHFPGAPLNPVQPTSRIPMRGLGPWLVNPHAIQPPPCTRTDTVVQVHTVHDWQPTGQYSARVYLATHPAFQWAINALEAAGVDADWMYHSSIGGSVWQLERRHITASTIERVCTNAVIARNVLRVDSLTDYQWWNEGWVVANGASGTYQASDNLSLVHEVQFSDWLSAYKYLYTPTPDSVSGKYYPIRAVAYSVGDYGFDWICQTSANAFTWRRWGFIAIPSPTGAWLYGTFGFHGISRRIDPFNPLPGHDTLFTGFQRGCVPGARCHYDNPTCIPGVQCTYGSPALQPPIHAMGLYESQLDGKGFQLDFFWNPRKNDWRTTGAGFISVQPTWPQGTEFAGSVRGWQ